MFGTIMSAVIIGLGIANLENHGALAIVIGLLMFGIEYKSMRDIDKAIGED